MYISPVLEYAKEAYGYLLPHGTASLNDFADLIAKSYDPAEPHNAAVIAELRAHTGIAIGKNQTGIWYAEAN